MEISVKLQEPFSYAVWPVICLGVIVIGGLIWFSILMLRKSMRNKPAVKAPRIKQRTPEQIAHIKGKYLHELGRIESDFSANKLNHRAAYQKMSVCIRKFVYEVTGIKVQHYTLSDIRRLNMPMLETLIIDYYTPEFSRMSAGDVRSSINKTKRVIEGWR